jgi:hypothetical protein
VLSQRQVRAGHPLTAARSNLEIERKDHHMSVLMAKAKIKTEGVADVKAATEKLFAAIDAAQPEGIRYASLLLADGQTFVAILQLDDEAENPVPGLPEFRELQEVVDGSRAEPNTVEQGMVVGSYRLF